MNDHEYIQNHSNHINNYIFINYIMNPKTKISKEII